MERFQNRVELIGEVALRKIKSVFRSRLIFPTENPLLGETSMPSPTDLVSNVGVTTGHAGGWWNNPEFEGQQLQAAPNPLSRTQSTAMDLQRSLIRPTFSAQSTDNRILLPLNEGEEGLVLEGEMSLLPVSHKTVDLLFPWYRRFSRLSPFKRALGIVGSPIWVMLRLTVPVVDAATMDFAGGANSQEEEPLARGGAGDRRSPVSDVSDTTVLAEDDEDEAPGPRSPPSTLRGIPPWARLNRAPLRWHRWLSAINVLLFPIVATYGLAGLGSSVGNSSMPAWSLAILIGAFSSAIFVMATRNDQPPRWYGALAFVGFIAGIVWIYLIANQLVGLLQTLGIIFGVNETIMGLTIFAWGNSMGDLMTDISLARMGYAEIAMGACYGSPMLSR